MSGYAGWILPGNPAVVLAPMEGVTDAPMRAFLTERGGFSFCVSEFLRVSQEIPPKHVFHHHIPELKSGSKTPSGTPVQVQLLGGDEGKMAASALRAIEAGAKAIDLNFGCPSPTVNRHDGGATLLKYPKRIHSVVKAVREAVPAAIPVSAKLRLGWESVEDIFVNAEAAASAGASWLTIHARTRVQGYAPPAHWKLIGQVKKRLQVPVIANGEIWTLEDFRQCREETQCEHFMLGRGALGNPDLVFEVARELGSGNFDTTPRHDWHRELGRFAEICEPVAQRSHYTLKRIKQWLRYVNFKFPLTWYDEAKRVQSLEEFFTLLERQIKI